MLAMPIESHLAVYVLYVVGRGGAKVALELQTAFSLIA
jgi:hypothetical protein